MATWFDTIYVTADNMKFPQIQCCHCLIITSVNSFNLFNFLIVYQL